MKKICLLIVTSFFGSMFAQASAAQSDLACPRYMRLSGVPDTALPDLVEPPIAYPGAFGGTVVCVLEVDGTGIGGFFAEFLPSDGSIIQDIYYKYNSIQSYLRFEGENEPRNLVAGCIRRNAGGFICNTDLTAGDGLRVIRFFDEDWQISDIRVMASPSDGLVDDIVWESIKDKVRTDPETRIEIVMSLPEMPEPITLPPIDDFAGQIAYGISGQPAFDFMVALYASDSPLNLEINVYDIAFNQRRTISQNKTIPSGNYGFMINHLAKIEQLLVDGYEGSKSLDFR
jgi:hypothetical protein